MKFVMILLDLAVPVLFAQNLKKADEWSAKARLEFRKFTTTGYEDAIKLYEKSLNEVPTAAALAGMAETTALLAFESEQAGSVSSSMYEKALSYASRAVALDSNSSLAHRAMAVAWFNKDAAGHGNEVFESLNRALTLDSNDAESYYWLWLHVDNENPESPLILKALNLNDKLFRAHYALGVLYARRDQFDKAFSHYTVCKSISDKNYRPWFSQGIAFSRQKKYEAAIVEYRRALALNNRLNEAYLYLGLAYYYTDRNRDAKKTLQKYLELVPASNNRPQVESILKEIQ